MIESMTFVRKFFDVELKGARVRVWEVHGKLVITDRTGSLLKREYSTTAKAIDPKVALQMVMLEFETKVSESMVDVRNVEQLHLIDVPTANCVQEAEQPVRLPRGHRTEEDWKNSQSFQAKTPFETKQCSHSASEWQIKNGQRHCVRCNAIPNR